MGCIGSSSRWSGRERWRWRCRYPSWLVPGLSGMASGEMGLNEDRKSTRLNSSHPSISYAVFCLKKKKKQEQRVVHEDGVNRRSGRGDDICDYGRVQSLTMYVLVCVAQLVCAKYGGVHDGQCRRC